MEDYIEVSAKTKEDAIIEASIQLGTSSDNIEYDVIQEATSGLFGIGRKPAIIRARKKRDVSLDFEEAVREPMKDISPKKDFLKKPARKIQKDQPKQRQEKKFEKKAEKKSEKSVEKSAEKKIEKTEEKSAENKFDKDAEKSIQKKNEKPADRPVEVQNTDEEVNIVSVKEKVPVNKEEAQKAAKEFLEKTFAAMEMEVKIETSFDKEDNMNIELSGTDMGILIGKRGQTLDSIQYLTSLVVNKGKASYVRVKVDTENYRERRKETLENLAKNIAFKVKRTRKPVFLEPMNPYERRVIHSALQNDPQISTHSEGEEPYRKVVVTLKK